MTLAAHGLSIVAMGSISNARAVYGLSASGTPTKTNVGGSATIGVSQAQESYTTADIAYSFTVTSTTSSDNVTLDMDTGIVTANFSPVVTDGDGNDFEGSTLPTLLKINAIYIEAGSVEAGIIGVTPSDLSLPSIQFTEDGQSILSMYSNPMTLSADQMIIGFTAADQVITVTVIGSTT